MNAVIETGGKQYKVKAGDVIHIEKVDSSLKQVSFEPLLIIFGNEVKVGAPRVPGASVIAEVVSEKKGDKLTVFKFRRRKGYRRRVGHRQTYSTLRIVDIQTS